MLKCRIHLLTVVAILQVLGCGSDTSGPATRPAPLATTPAESKTEGSAASADTPDSVIKGMLALAQAGKWEEYVRTYYGEKHKMDNPDEQVAKVAARIEKMGPQLIEVLKGCVGQEPVLSEDSNMATFPNSYKLYKHEGSWGFHL